MLRFPPRRMHVAVELSKETLYAWNAAKGIADAGAPLVMVDIRGRIVLANGEAEELSGTTVEILPSPRFRAAHPRYRANYHNDPGNGIRLQIE